MTREQEIRVKALEIAAMILGPNATIWLDLAQGGKIEDKRIKGYLDLAGMLEPRIREDRQHQT